VKKVKGKGGSAPLTPLPRKKKEQFSMLCLKGKGKKGRGGGYFSFRCDRKANFQKEGGLRVMGKEKRANLLC